MWDAFKQYQNGNISIKSILKLTTFFIIPNAVYAVSIFRVILRSFLPSDVIMKTRKPNLFTCGTCLQKTKINSVSKLFS